MTVITFSSPTRIRVAVPLVNLDRFVEQSKVQGPSQILGYMSNTHTRVRASSELASLAMFSERPIATHQLNGELEYVPTDPVLVEVMDA